VLTLLSEVFLSFVRYRQRFLVNDPMVLKYLVQGLFDDGIWRNRHMFALTLTLPGGGSPDTWMSIFASHSATNGRI
jgi:hypothetical protein